MTKRSTTPRGTSRPGPLDEQERPLTPVAAAAVAAVVRATKERAGRIEASLLVHSSARGLTRTLGACSRHRDPLYELPIAAIAITRIGLGAPGAPVRRDPPRLLLAEELPDCCRAAADPQGIARRFGPNDLSNFIGDLSGGGGAGQILVAHSLRAELLPALEAAGVDPTGLVARGVDLIGVAGYLWEDEIAAVRERDLGAEPLGLAALSGLGDRMGSTMIERLRASELAFARLWGGLWSLAHERA